MEDALNQPPAAISETDASPPPPAEDTTGLVTDETAK
jgi:hypothetical protein